MSWLLTIPLGSFIAGLAAFPHCALMCGPLFALFSSSWYAYHIGRVLGYTLVGALLGALSLGLDATGLFLSLQNFSVLLIAVFFVLYGLAQIVPVHSPASFSYTKSLSRVMGRLRASPHATWGIFVSGLLSALLPCGVLIPLWALCASSGSPLFGASMTFAFVLGTIPGALLFPVILNQKWWKRLQIRRSFRFLSAALLLSLGLLILGYRGLLTPHINAASPIFEGKAGAQCAPGLPLLQ